MATVGKRLVLIRERQWDYKFSFEILVHCPNRRSSKLGFHLQKHGEVMKNIQNTTQNHSVWHWLLKFGYCIGYNALQQSSLEQPAHSSISETQKYQISNDHLRTWEVKWGWLEVTPLSQAVGSPKAGTSCLCITHFEHSAMWFPCLLIKHAGRMWNECWTCLN